MMNANKAHGKAKTYVLDSFWGVDCYPIGGHSADFFYTMPL